MRLPPPSAFAVIVAATLLGCPARPPAPVRHSLTVTVTGAGEGIVASSPAGVDACTKVGGACSAEFDEQTTVTLTATPASGYFFAGWAGACAGVATCTVSMDQVRTLQAVFVPVLIYSLLPLSNGETLNDHTNAFSVRSDGTGLTAMTALRNADVYLPLWSPDGNRILHGSSRSTVAPYNDVAGTTNNLWLVDSTGSNPTPLTEFGSAWVDTFTWTRDGRILYGSSAALDGGDVPSATNLWLMNADGSGKTAITEQTSVGIDTYFFSVSATDAFFNSNRGLSEGTRDTDHGVNNVFRVPLTGGPAVPLTAYDNAQAVYPSVSPNGEQVIFLSNHVTDPATDASMSGFNVWVVGADGTGARPLTHNTSGAMANKGFWSPDGTFYLFDSDMDPSGGSGTVARRNVFRVNVATGELVALTSLLNTRSSTAGYSPDGTTVIFESSRSLGGGDLDGRNTNVFAMNPDGSSITPLTSSITANSYVPWDVD